MQEQKAKHKETWGKKLRAQFLAGILVVVPVAAPPSVIRTPSATMPLTVPEMLYAPVDVKFCPVIFPPLTVTE